MYNSLVKKVSIIHKTALMFKKKKTSLIRKIWKLVKLSGITKIEATDLKSKLRSLLKSLGEKDLEILLRSLQTNGGIETECIHVKTSELRHYTKYIHSDPKFILAQAFRYPQLTQDDYLRSLVCCQYNLCSQEQDGCINPFHSSLVVYTESPLPPYSETPSCPSAVTTTVSASTNDTICSTNSERTCSSSCSTTKPTTSLGTSLTMNLFPDDPCAWCCISYWEQKHRIGRMFDVSQNSINVFENLPQGGGLCLGLLNRGNVEKTDACEKVRESIGHGFQLSKEPDGVWLYNRSNIVLFTSSPTIQTEGVGGLCHPVVKRLTPGSSVLVLDPNFLPDVNEKMKSIGQSISFFKNDTSEDSGSYVNKLYPYCVRVSFGKGWGLNYTRMSITQCPCWVEIYLNVQVSSK